MKSAVRIVLMIFVIQIGQILVACKKDDGLSEDLLDLLCKSRKQNTGIEGLTRTTRPAFTASLTSKINLAANSVIKFDKVWLNTGDIYNPSTGVFTVPMNGLYMVSSSMMSDSGKYLHCHLWKNSQSNVGVYGIGYSQGSLNAVMDLKKGEHLSIRHDNKSGENAYGAHWSMFSAYLISE